MARSPIPITAGELDEWRRVYPTGGAAAVQALFPHRSKNTIKVTCWNHGIRMPDPEGFRIKNLRAWHADKSECRFKGQWSALEDAAMRALWPTISTADMAWVLPHRTAGAIRHRASFLNLRKPHVRPIGNAALQARRARLKELFTAPHRVPA